MESGKYYDRYISMVQSGSCHCEGDPQACNDYNDLIKNIHNANNCI